MVVVVPVIVAVVVVVVQGVIGAAKPHGINATCARPESNAVSKPDDSIRLKRG